MEITAIAQRATPTTVPSETVYFTASEREALAAAPVPWILVVNDRTQRSVGYVKSFAVNDAGDLVVCLCVAGEEAELPRGIALETSVVYDGRRVTQKHVMAVHLTDCPED